MEGDKSQKVIEVGTTLEIRREYGRMRESMQEKMSVRA